MTAAAKVTEETKHLSVSEAADLLDAPARSVRRWCENGSLPAVRLGPKLWKIPIQTLRERFAFASDEDRDGELEGF